MTFLRPLDPAHARQPFPVATTSALTEGRAGGARTLREVAAGLVLALLVLAPLAVVRIPFLVDYPNHLARMHVLATGAASPALHAIFRIDWAFIPNMAMDLLVPMLARFMPLTVAGKVMIAIAMLLPPLGAVALHRAWFRERAWWPWIAILASASAFLAYGFLNYLAAVGLALLGGAWHAGTADRRDARRLVPDTILAAAWGVVCLLSHIMGYGLLALLMVSNEIARPRRTWRWYRAVPVLAAILVPLALYRAFGPAHNYTDGSALRLAAWQILHDGLFRHMAVRLYLLFAAYTGESVQLGVVLAAVTALPVLWAAWRRRLRLAPQMLLPVLCLGAGYLLLPSDLVDNGLVYERLIVPLTLIVIAGVQPRLPARLAGAVGVAVVALLAGRSLLIGRLWAQQATMLAQVEHAIAPIPAGARVLAVRDGASPWGVDPDEPAARRIVGHLVDYEHLPALVTLERDAFWPMIFTEAGKQPVALRPAYEREAQSEGYLPLTAQLGPAMTIPPPPGRCHIVHGELPCQLWSWPRRYDYLLRLNAHATAPPAAAHLQEVARDGWAILYRVH